MWSLLGPRPVTMLAWESFGAGWVTDVAKQLKLDADIRTADYGEICRPRRDRSGERRRLHLERHDQRRPRARRRLDRRRPHRPHHLRRDLGGVRAGHRLGEDRCRHLQLAEGARRRGGARHAGPQPARGRAARARARAAAAAQDLPPDQRRQADRRHLQGRDDQHALDAVRRGLAVRARLGGADRRPRGADRPRRRQCRGARPLGAERPTGSSISPPTRRSARTPRSACNSPTAPTPRRTRRGRRRSSSCSKRRTRPTTSAPIATRRRACASGAARRSTPPTSRRSGRGSTGPGRQTT